MVTGYSAVGSAPALGAGCRVFESLYSDHFLKEPPIQAVLFLCISYIIKLLLKKSANNRKINFETSYIKRNSLRKKKGVSFSMISIQNHFVKRFHQIKLDFAASPLSIRISCAVMD